MFLQSSFNNYFSSKMVGQGSSPKEYKLEDVLTEKQVRTIISKTFENRLDYNLVRAEVKPVSEGLAGFLGDHLRVTLYVAVGDKSEVIQLFLKRLPLHNPSKVDFITENNFFKREAMVCQLLEELQVPNDPQPWCVPTLVSNDHIIVMPDMRPLGYQVLSQMETLDLPHVLSAVASVARFHAATANYETRRTAQTNKSWTFSQEHTEILEEPSFKDTPFLRACTKLAANILKVFSHKYNAVPDLEAKLITLFLDACDTLKEFDDTLNVLLHKDLWVSNIMFRYENGEPVNALLIDYQCLRYGPPAFDLMLLLYCATSRSFREQYEAAVFTHYNSVLLENLEEATKQKVDKLGFDEKAFFGWCQKARMYAAVQAISLFPYILMDPVAAKKTYDNPDTFQEVMWTDRTEPVVQYCRQNPDFKDRLLEVLEEFVERYMTCTTSNSK